MPIADTTVLKDSDPAKRSRGVIGKVTRVIRFLGGKDIPCGLAEVAREAGLAKTTAHRLLRALEAERVVRRTSAGYELRERHSTMGLAGDGHAIVRRHALKGMLSLYESTHMLVQLMVVEADSVRCIDQFEPPGESMLSLPIDFGRRWPALRVASGKVLLFAGSPRPEAEPSALRLSYDDGMTNAGLLTAAVPITIRGGGLAAISLSGPRAAMSRAEIREKMLSISRRCEYEHRRLACRLTSGGFALAKTHPVTAF
ncbi:helix-turn-helix domain-containing protein [Amycolatopsis orientalis]|nr:helix-turn-helix domain-containing protein [Amycolatopsis orientalis]